MDILNSPPPVVPAQQLQASLFAHYGIRGALSPLPSERDQNYRVDGDDGQRYLLKISNAAESSATLEFQAALLRHVEQIDPELPLPRLHRTGDGRDAFDLTHGDAQHRVRLLSYLPGAPIGNTQPGDRTYRSLGDCLARLDRALRGFGHPAGFNDLDWDLRHTARSGARLHCLHSAEERAIVVHFLERFAQRTAPRLGTLRAQVIHNDASDWNVLVTEDATATVCGLIDLGDAGHSPLIAELAIASTYAVMAASDPLLAAARIAAAYHAQLPLEESELDLLYDLIAARLCISVTMSAARRASENTYLRASEQPAWGLLRRWYRIDPQAARSAFRQACGFERIQVGVPVSMPAAPSASGGRDPAQLLQARRRCLNPALSLSYASPLKIVRGQGVWLYDAAGRAYLDCYNNVAHVGHCHPRVVEAIARQAAVLNTNTRYLHDTVVDYAERLGALLPGDLSVCCFVSSGSEANDLALRIARETTGRRDLIVIDWAYHGHTQALIEASPYKYKRSGGRGRAAHIHEVPMPDAYRRTIDGSDSLDLEALGASYAQTVEDTVRRLVAEGRPPAAFIAESVLSCGGQVFLPRRYLERAYAAVRAAGGLCIADEVQVGFGRVGTHYWAFEEFAVTPDIVTLGKPIGNGHPLAATITTPSIANAFANGMEYFATFGGNPVSCAAGIAVLDVLDAEGLLANAGRQGETLMAAFAQLAQVHDIIGDVRGRGLFLGMELVDDRRSKVPATAAARRLVELCCAEGVLLGTDGPHANVIKLRPPMVFSNADSAQLQQVLAHCLARL